MAPVSVVAIVAVRHRSRPSPADGGRAHGTRFAAPSGCGDRPQGASIRSGQSGGPPAPLVLPSFPGRHGSGRGSRVRRGFHVSGRAYPRERIEAALLEAELPPSYRIVPRRYLAAPLGAPTADSRFCGKTEGYTVLYASPDFATAFLETVVRDIPPRPFALLAPRWPSRRMLGPGRVPYSGASTRHRRTGFRFDKPSRVLRRAPLGIGTFSLGDPPVLP